jgi:D-alanine-D-alanine ligase
MKAHQALGCRDLSRVDFILDGDGRLQVLEVNTIPGFTSHSLVPMAAARAGISFEELVDRLVMMAMAR